MVKRSFGHRTGNLSTYDAYIFRARIFSAWDLPSMS